MFSNLFLKVSEISFLPTPHCDNFYLTSKKPMWGFCQLLSISISVIHLGTREMITDGLVDLVHLLWAGLSLELQVPWFQHRIWPYIQQVSKYLSFPLSVVRRISWLSWQRSVWERVAGVLIFSDAFCIIVGSFLVGNWLLLQKEFLGLRTDLGLILGNSWVIRAKSQRNLVMEVLGMLKRN